MEIFFKNMPWQTDYVNVFFWVAGWELQPWTIFEYEAVLTFYRLIRCQFIYLHGFLQKVGVPLIRDSPWFPTGFIPRLCMEAVEHCLEIWGPVWEGFLCFVLHSWVRTISVEQSLSSEVLHLQVLFLFYLMLWVSSCSSLSRIHQEALPCILCLLLSHPLVRERWNVWRMKKGWTCLIWAAMCVLHVFC